MRAFPGCQPPVTSHIRIPAWYQAGITLFVKAGSPAFLQLSSEPGLPQEIESPSAGSGCSVFDSPEETARDLQVELNPDSLVESNQDLLVDDAQDLPEDSQDDILVDSAQHGSNIGYNCATAVPPCSNDLPVIAGSSTSGDSSNLRTLNNDDSINTLEQSESNQTNWSNQSNSVEGSLRSQNGEQSIPIPSRCVNCSEGQSNITPNISNVPTETRNIHRNIRSDFDPMEGTSNSVNFYDTGQLSSRVSNASNLREYQLQNCDESQANLHNTDQSGSFQVVGMETSGFTMETNGVVPGTSGVAMDTSGTSRQANIVAVDSNMVAMDRNSVGTESNAVALETSNVAMETNNVAMAAGNQTVNSVTPESHGAEQENSNVERLQSSLEDPVSENSQSSQHQYVRR